MEKRTTLTPEDIRAFEPEAKVGLLATVDAAGLPHITLITTLQAKSADRLMWGQFSEGRSKINVQVNPRVGFLVLTMDKRLWRGTARWTHTQNTGTDFERYNNLPMFRYNAYLGIHTVHHMDLRETGGEEKLPMAGIVAATLATRLARLGSARGKAILKPWAKGVFNDMATLKFLAYIAEDGYPRLIPLIQCQAAGTGTLIFSSLAYAGELRDVSPGMPVAVFALTMKMESVLVRGPFSGFGLSLWGRVGRVGIDWVYNSMPPKQGQIYPPAALRPVTEF
jgi:hypothetical protein